MDEWEWFEMVMDGVLKPEVIREIIQEEDWRRALYFVCTELEIETCYAAMLKHDLKELKKS